MRRAALLLVLALSTTPHPALAQPQPTLRLVSRSVSLVDGAPVLVRLELTNETAEPLVVPALFPGLTYSIELRDPSGQRLRRADCNGEAPIPALPAFRLKPGESLFALEALAEHYSAWGNASLQISASYTSTDAIGTWDAAAGPGEDAAGVWQGTVSSPSFSIALARPSQAVEVAIQELPGRDAVPACLDVAQKARLGDWLREHGGAGVLADWMELKIANWDLFTAVDAWVDAHPRSGLLRYGEYLRFVGSLEMREGALARRHMTPALLADSFFGPLVQQLEAKVVELEAQDAEWEVEDRE